MVSRMARVVFIVVAACGSRREEAPRKDLGSDTKAAIKPVTIAVDTINARVPARLKDKLAFSRREITHVLMGSNKSTTYALPAPTRWGEDDAISGGMTPDPAEELGLTRMSVGKICCDTSTWAEMETTWFYSSAYDNGRTIVRDKKTERSRLTTFADDGFTYIVYLWTAESRFHYCTARVDDRLPDAVPVFENACASAAVIRMD